MDNLFLADVGRYYVGIMEIDDSNDESLDNYEDIKVINGEFTSNYSLRIFASGCSFWRENEQVWSSEGCVVSFYNCRYKNNCLHGWLYDG